MLKVEIKEEDKSVFADERYNGSHPHVRQKMDALYLKSLGFANAEICKITGVCANTLLSFYREYMTGGIASLRQVRYNRPQSDLQAYKEIIIESFENDPPHSISEASSRIASLTGITRGETQTCKFLKGLGFRFRKVSAVPAKALSEEKKTSNASSWTRS